jgi:adenine-specific DNA-methyltransferase
MAEVHRPHLRVLDAGAGVGSLTAAWVTSLRERPRRPRRVTLTAHEIDETLHAALRDTLADCAAACARMGVACRWEVRGGDFIASMVAALDGGARAATRPAFDLAILNPPWRKLGARSRARALLRKLGVEASNLYAAFLALAVEALAPGGELVAITPRSFCNGPYFRPFRERLLDRTSLARVHAFASREEAFRDDRVLQENVVLRALRARPQQRHVLLSESHSPDARATRAARVPFARVVRPGDRERFIHLAMDGRADALAALPCTLGDLGLAVSTGRVVDFRARPWLRAGPSPGSVPLIYPMHFDAGGIAWPRAGAKKPDAIARAAARRNLLLPAGIYVLVKRFTAKEERRRIVAAVFDPRAVPCEAVGFENHLDYFHADGRPLDGALAWGLTLFLSSTPVDAFFRQWSGHTQVNATDLRALRYPGPDALRALGAGGPGRLPSQEAVDALVAPIL